MRRGSGRYRVRSIPPAAPKRQKEGCGIRQASRLCLYEVERRLLPGLFRNQDSQRAGIAQA
jgi:hypothetical protein